MTDKKLQDDPMVRVVSWIIALWFIGLVLLCITVGVVQWLF